MKKQQQTIILNLTKMKNALFLYSILLVRFAYAQEGGHIGSKGEQNPYPYTNNTRNGCIYYRPYQGDSLVALAVNNTTLIVLKRKEEIDTVLCKNERMHIKDIQIFNNKCIIVYVSNFTLSYFAMIKSPKWLMVYNGGGHRIPGVEVSALATSDEIKNTSPIRSIQLHTPTLKIISENELLVSDRFGKKFFVEIDYSNKKDWKVRYFNTESSKFIVLEAGMEIAVLSLGRNGRDTVWINRKKNLNYTIDTIIYKNNILEFVSLSSVWEYSNRKLSYTYRAFQWNGQIWKPILEKPIGLYESYPAEVKEVKHVAYNQVKVIQTNGQKTLIEYDIITQTEKKTVSKE